LALQKCTYCSETRFQHQVFGTQHRKGGKVCWLFFLYLLRSLTLAQGLGKGGAKRYPKILCDNIRGVMKPTIHRSAHRGGVKHISGLIYEETRLENVHLFVFSSRLIPNPLPRSSAIQSHTPSMPSKRLPPLLMSSMLSSDQDTLSVVPVLRLPPLLPFIYVSPM